MPSTGRRRIVVLGGAVLLLAVVTAGCARRSTSGAATAPTPIASQVEDAGMPVPSPEPTVPGPAATPVSGPIATAIGTPVAAPVATPNLSAIDGLIKDIDNELGADASAGADEGTTP